MISPGIQNRRKLMQQVRRTQSETTTQTKKLRWHLL